MALPSPISLFLSHDPQPSPHVLPALIARPTTSFFKSPQVFGSKLNSGEIEHTHLRLSTVFRRLFCNIGLRGRAILGLTFRDKNVFILMTSPGLTMNASSEPPGLTQELSDSRLERVAETESGSDLFENIKHRFLSFKKHKYMENVEHYEKLANGQAPKFMVIACADSRVCPSAILGFQPGESFTVRNIANLVPPFEKGPSETNAGLEFAVNTLKVENVLVIGHSCCGGIRALMSMEDEGDSSSFIRNWVVLGRNAKLKTKAAASNLSFDQQCKHCEKESVNRSLLNLLTYPWIEEKVREGVLSVHGGYYDFVDCTFEKWTLDYKESSLKEGDERISVKDRLFWC